MDARPAAERADRRRGGLSSAARQGRRFPVKLPGALRRTGDPGKHSDANPAGSAFRPGFPTMSTPRTSTSPRLLPPDAAWLGLGFSLVPFLAPVSALADPLTWTGASGGTWNTATNWEPNQTPTTADSLTILGPGNVAGNLSINVDAAAAAGSISFTNSSATTLSNTSGGSNQTLTLGSGSLNGLATGSGAVTIGSSTSNQGVDIALGANQTWNVGSGGLTAVNAISGGFSLTKSGSGTLSLNGSNTFSGGLVIGGGTVNANSGGALGTGTVTLDSGGRLDLFSNPTSPAGFTFNGGQVNARGGSRSLSQAVTFGGDFTLGSANQGGNSVTLSGSTNLGGATRAITVEASGGASITGAISNGGLTKVGSGQLNISNGSNSYSGPVTIQNGTLRVTGSGALGTGTSAIALGDATSIGSNFSPTLMVNAATTISRDIIAGAGNGATSGTYTITTDNGFSAWGISGNTTLNQSLTISNGSTGGTTLSGNITSGSSGAKTLTLNNGATGFGANMTVSGTIGGGSGTIGVTKLGTGYVRFTGAHTYTGDTRIGAGILQLDIAGTSQALQNSTLDLNGSDTGVLEFRGSTGTVGAVVGGLKGSRNLTLQNTSGNAVVLTVGGNNQSTTYSGALGGNGSLAKTGTGVLTLSGTNTYTGATTVSAGTLVVDGSLGNSAVTVEAGATLGGSGTVGGATTVHGILAPGNSPGIMTYGSDLTLGSGAIFEWELFSHTDSLASRGAPDGYDGVNVGGNFVADGLFRIILGGTADFSDDFWKSSHTWQQVFNVTGTTTDNGFAFELWDNGAGSAVTDLASYGSFSFNSSDGGLTWSAVPEPGGALVGLLVAAGLLRRRRRPVV